MSGQTPGQLAETAAESIRALNHALYNGLDTRGDAYTLVGQLARLASMLPQALTMTRQAVEKLQQEGNLRSDHDALTADLARTYGGLRTAAKTAQTLHGSIGIAHAGLGHISMQDGAL
jgi:hypothetical protein